MNDKIKIVVVKSQCDKYSVGDEIVFDGALIDKERSANLCMMAINAMFPFIYAARKGVIHDEVMQCPDCAECVEFVIQEVES